MQSGRRRHLALLGGLLAAASFPSPGQSARPRIGILSPAPLTSIKQRYRPLWSGLAELGYVEGKNLDFEVRSAEGAYERLRPLAEELVGLKVDLIVAVGTPAAQAAKSATGSIPVVVVGAGDPVASGLVASLARPGGNLTGTSNISPPLILKRLELLKEALPATRRAALLMNPANPAQRLSLEAMHRAGQQLNVEVHEFPARNGEEIRAGFPRIAREGVEALVVANDSILIANAGAIARHALEQRIPSAGNKEYTYQGGLIGYGSIEDVYRHSAIYIDKILKGANPADLPIEQPSKFEVILNVKTAREMRLALAPAFLARADRVIQ
jgi:putative ABC transport system substrate-binding protein